MLTSPARRFFGFRIIPVWMLIILLFSCDKQLVEPTKFSLLSSSQTGVDFTNQLRPSPSLNILNYIYYYNGAGVAAGDFNNDGLTDLYFTGNQTQDKLYINKGDFVFEPLPASAGIDNALGWTTGVTLVDINQDGWLDLYVSKVGDYGGLKGHNLLFVNQGKDSNGQVTFKESAASYGLDFSGFSTQASFFDYDLDGDLDMYLLNHSVQPNSNYGSGNKRMQVDPLSGDRLYNNDAGFYSDVSSAAGINQGTIGYGLGLAVSDLNQDGYPDIYIGNDFFENDYLYINQKDGTFLEVISGSNNPMGHTTHYSMGNDIADVNNDGLMDVISVDMLPDDLNTLKTSGVEFGFQTYQNYLKNGYEPQYMQNTLHVNRGNASFSEVANLTGIAATDWSWAPLLADFDNDGYNDLFVTNGILGATNDMDFINFIANDNIQKALSEGMSEQEMAFIKELPQKKTANYLFKNNGELGFNNKTKEWLGEQPSFSNGAVYTDLNNDGLLDLVVSNVNQPAFVYKNNANKDSIASNFVAIDLKAELGNINAIGGNVTIYSTQGAQTKERQITRGYLSGKLDPLHFGLGADQTIDSVLVTWPDNSSQVFTEVAVNRMQVLIKDSVARAQSKRISQLPLLVRDSIPGLDLMHKDNLSLDFNRDPLIPYASSNLGPALAVGDLNNDGNDDIFFGGGKGQAAQVSFQNKDASFGESWAGPFIEQALIEDTAAIIFDADGDGINELLVVSGGNEFLTGDALKPRLYSSKTKAFDLVSNAFEDVYVDASSVSAVDFDHDDDLDVLITSATSPRNFGETPRQYLLTNNGNGVFTDTTNLVAPALENIGNVTHAEWLDFNNDGWEDLIVVGHWMTPSIFINHEGALQLLNSNLDQHSGLWNTIKAADFDGDGDLDFVAGNWGLNSRLTASQEEPLKLYRQDFDGNGATETLVTYYYKGTETAFASKDELVKQMPGLNKTFLSYKDFAAASLQQLFGEDSLNTAIQKQVTTLSSTYFENLGNGQFNISSLPFWTQVSQVNDIFVKDFNGDGNKDLFLVGNNQFISTQLGQLDALKGELLISDGAGGFSLFSQKEQLLSGAASIIKSILIDGQEYIIVGVNNSAPLILKVTK
ncbi:MAG: VCBS repeat-containing protein [Gilvibacter sp.]